MDVLLKSKNSIKSRLVQCTFTKSEICFFSQHLWHRRHLRRFRVRHSGQSFRSSKESIDPGLSRHLGLGFDRVGAKRGHDVGWKVLLWVCIGWICPCCTSKKTLVEIIMSVFRSDKARYKPIRILFRIGIAKFCNILKVFRISKIDAKCYHLMITFVCNF